MSCQMETSEPITKEDITVQWQTLAGKTEDSQKEQFAVADVTISAQGKVISQRKVSFIGKALDLAADAVERKGEAVPRFRSHGAIMVSHSSKNNCISGLTHLFL